MHPLLNVALKAARKAGGQIVRASEQLGALDIEEKSRNDYVSEVDRASERELVYQIHKAYPNHRILGEEGGMQAGRAADPDDVLWIIDPLDGTTNYLRGIPHYAISMAVQVKGRLEHALVYDPVRDEAFTASRGQGARVNDKRMRVTNRRTLDGALLGTGIPFNEQLYQHNDAYFACLAELAPNTAGIRRAGAAALDLAYVAAGRLDAFWEIGLQPWDVAAGALLVQEAGGLVGDFQGGSNYLESGNIVCGGPKCFKALLKTVNHHLGHIK